METNQEKVKAIVGEEVYQRLANSGFFALEVDHLQTIITHVQQFEKLQKQLDELEEVVIPKDRPMEGRGESHVRPIDGTNRTTVEPKRIPA